VGLIIGSMLPRDPGLGAASRRACPAGRGKLACYAPAVPEPPVHPAIRRVLDAAERKGVILEVLIFDESTHTAEDAARALGVELGQIVKSLVFVHPAEGGGLDAVLCLASGPNRVDVARLAAVSGEPEIRRATAREANELTGYTIGGIPPIGHPRPLRVIMDPDLGRFQLVWAAAGTPTAVFPVPPATLRLLANAHVAPISQDQRSPEVPIPGNDGVGELTGSQDPGTQGGGVAAGPATTRAAGV